MIGNCKSNFCIHFSKCFVTVSNAPITTILTHICRLCLRILSICIGKSHKILQSSDSKTFSGLCMYHFSALLNPNFSHSFLATLACFTCFYSFCARFENPGTICATVSSAALHTRQIDWSFFHRPHCSYSCHGGVGLVLLNSVFSFFL